MQIHCVFFFFSELSSLRGITSIVYGSSLASGGSLLEQLELALIWHGVVLTSAHRCHPYVPPTIKTLPCNDNTFLSLGTIEKSLAHLLYTLPSTISQPPSPSFCLSEQSSSQPFFIECIFLAPSHFCDPSQDFLQYACVYLASSPESIQDSGSQMLRK